MHVVFYKLLVDEPIFVGPLVLDSLHCNSVVQYQQLDQW